MPALYYGAVVSLAKGEGQLAVSEPAIDGLVVHSCYPSDVGLGVKAVGVDLCYCERIHMVVMEKG